MVKYSLTLVLGIVLYTALPQGVLALVNINTATLDELKTLHGIKDALSLRIEEARPFSSIEDIKRVSGIGEVTYEAIKNDITVSGNTAVIVETESRSNNETSSNSSSGGNTTAKVTKSTSPGPITGLTLSVPEKAYTGQLLSFDVNPDDGKEGRMARYKWNFGDGTTDDSKSATHRYNHSGTYVVMVESYYQKETKLARKEIEILPLALKLETISAYEMKVTNNGSYEIDLGSMQLVGKTTFTFPKYTILLPNQSLVAKVDSVGNVVLKDGEGVMLVMGATERRSPQHQPTVASTKRTVTKVASPVEATSTEKVSIEEAKNDDDVALTATNQTASASSADIPREAWPYLALFAVMGLGIFALYGTKS